MNMTAPQGRLSYTQLGAGDKTSQAGAPFTKNNIWGGHNVIGGGYTTKRDALGSRGSDEASPTATSGSAQLSRLSEADQHPWSRPPVWNSDPASQRRPGQPSPSRTRANGLNQNSIPDASYFQPSAGHNAAAYRTNERGSVDQSSTPIGQPLFGVASDEDQDNGASYPSFPSKYHNRSSSYKRGSQDTPIYLGMGQASTNNTPASARPSEFGNQSGHMNGNYSFDSTSYGHGLGGSSRPSVSHNSSFPRGAGSSRGFSAGHNGSDSLSELARGLSLNDSPEVNSFANPASQQFQLNPGSQPWSMPSEVASNGRTFGQNFNQDVYLEQMSGGQRKMSGSPAANAQQPAFGSPRYGNAPNPRADSWSRAPSVASISMIQDTDRQATGPQYLAQNAAQHTGYYANAPYFPSAFPQYTQGIYDNYAQGQGGAFRGPHVQLPPFGMPFSPGAPHHGRHGKDRDHRDLGQGMRSQLLEDYRATNKPTKRFELRHIYNHIVEFCGDQYGSRFIQEKLQTANSDEKEQVFKEIEPNALQLMKDVFGNYVIQKFFEHGNQLQKKLLANKMKGKVAELSQQMYGCRVVQKALEHVLVEQQRQIVDELEPNIMTIAKDQNGNHVVQKVVAVVPQECWPFILETFRGHIHSLSLHGYGCRVIQRMLENDDQSLRRPILDEILAGAKPLLTDQFGNYVVQHVITHGEDEDRSQIIGHVISDLFSLSKHKFASNVVEKCIDCGTPEQRRMIMLKFTEPATGGPSQLHNIMQDQYGNYVIQKLAKALDGREKDCLLEHINTQLETLRRANTGRGLPALERLESCVKENVAAAAAPRSSNNPTTPGLHIDVNSAAPTPDLTATHNSPDSNSPPSTNLSVADEGGVEYTGAGAGAGTGKSKAAGDNGRPTRVVVQDGDEAE